MNVVTLVGRMARDPELRYTTTTGTAMCTFTIAVDRQYSNKEGQKVTDFFNVVSWGKQAENCGKYLKKGSKVAVEGSISTSKYKNNKDVMVYQTEILAHHVEFLDSKKSENTTDKESNANFDDFQSIEDDNDSDVPF